MGGDVQDAPHLLKGTQFFKGLSSGTRGRRFRLGLRRGAKHQRDGGPNGNPAARATANGRQKTGLHRRTVRLLATSGTLGGLSSPRYPLVKFTMYCESSHLILSAPPWSAFSMAIAS